MSGVQDLRWSLSHDGGNAESTGIWNRVAKGALRTETLWSQGMSSADLIIPFYNDESLQHINWGDQHLGLS